jgi:DUF4097 and DUF4098 domain-containing protein YvlB
VLTSFAAGLLAALSVAQQTDTIVSVRPGTRLEVDNFAGRVVVRTWDRPSAVRIVAEHSSLTEVDIDTSDVSLSVSASGRHGMPTAVDYTITIPPSMPVEISGVQTQVDVEGVKGDVSVETVQGDVRVSGGSGFLSLSTVDGLLDLQRSSGRIELSAVNQGIHVADAKGDIVAETVNGDLRLERVDSGSVEASTVNGEVVFDGTIKDDGRYSFSTHNGGVSVAVPPSANVTVSVDTYQGAFVSSFPITRRERDEGKSFGFSIGSGSASLDIESFQGTIQLRRPGEPPSVGDESDGQGGADDEAR